MASGAVAGPRDGVVFFGVGVWTTGYPIVYIYICKLLVFRVLLSSLS